MTHESLREVKCLPKTTQPHRECILWAPSPSDVLQVNQVWEGEKVGLGVKETKNLPGLWLLLLKAGLRGVLGPVPQPDLRVPLSPPALNHSQHQGLFQ